MFSSSNSQDYLDSLFSGRSSRDNDQGRIVNKLPILPLKSNIVRNYPDKIRNKVRGVKKRKKQDSVHLSSSNEYRADESADQIDYRNDHIASRKERIQLRNHSDNECTDDGDNARAERNAAQLPSSHFTEINVNQLKIFSAEFFRCCALRESFAQQLELYISSFSDSKSSLPVSISLSIQFKGYNLSPPKPYKGTESQRQQFLLLIIALRKNTTRVVECYQKIYLRFKNDNSENTLNSLQKMRKEIKIIVERCNDFIFPEPFSSWLFISPHNNIFFIGKKINGTSAYFPTKFLNEKKLNLPVELRIESYEIENLEILGNFVCEILELVRVEESNNQKIRRNREIFDSFLQDDNDSDYSAKNDNNKMRENIENNRFRGDDEDDNEDNDSYQHNEYNSPSEKIHHTTISHNVDEDDFILNSISAITRIYTLKNFLKIWRKTRFSELKIRSLLNYRNQKTKEQVSRYLSTLFNIATFHSISSHLTFTFLHLL